MTRITLCQVVPDLGKALLDLHGYERWLLARTSTDRFPNRAAPRSLYDDRPCPDARSFSQPDSFRMRLSGWDWRPMLGRLE